MFYHTEEAMASKEKELQKKITELEVWQCFMNSRNSKHVSKHILVFVKSTLINIFIIKLLIQLEFGLMKLNEF